MFVIISHMHFAGAFSATETYIASCMEEAKIKCVDILKKKYKNYCEDEQDDMEFEIVNISKIDESILMMNYIAAYKYKGGYGEIVTISKAN